MLGPHARFVHESRVLPLQGPCSPGRVPGITADITVRYTMTWDVKTLSVRLRQGQRELYHGGTARAAPAVPQCRRRAPVAERARRVNGEYIAKARTLDRRWTTSTAGRRTARATQACVSRCRCRVTQSPRRPSAGGAAGLGPGARPGGGLVPAQGCSEALHGLAREAAKAKATAKWRQISRLAADGGAERARGAGDLPARRAPPLG
jgi:hypothetical protein